MSTNHIESYSCQLGHQDHHQDHHDDDDDDDNGRSINKASKNDIEGEREQALVDQWVGFLSSSLRACAAQLGGKPSNLLIFQSVWKQETGNTQMPWIRKVPRNRRNYKILWILSGNRKTTKSLEKVTYTWHRYRQTETHSDIIEISSSSIDILEMEVRLTDERNAVIAPTPGSGIPGAPPVEVPLFFCLRST